ncbi:MAG: SprT family zinc-dependent metalloprotease [Bdellovibrionales bacterium]
MSNTDSEGFITLNGERIEFSVSRSKRRKRTIAFKFVQGARLHVQAPFLATLSSIERILINRAPWIMREHAFRKSEDGIKQFTDGATFCYLGYPCVLNVTCGKGALSSCRLSPRSLRVHVSEEKLSFESLRQEVRLEIVLWMKKRAKVKLKKRLDFWAKRLGVKYKKFVMANPRQRWGSCSPDNIIRLNWRLMMAPLPILDYVVAHELCHIRHKNHSPRFWGFLAGVMPDYKARRRILRHVERNIETLE